MWLRQALRKRKRELKHAPKNQRKRPKKQTGEPAPAKFPELLKTPTKTPAKTSATKIPTPAKTPATKTPAKTPAKTPLTMTQRRLWKILNTDKCVLFAGPEKSGRKTTLIDLAREKNLAPLFLTLEDNLKTAFQTRSLEGMKLIVISIQTSIQSPAKFSALVKLLPETRFLTAIVIPDTYDPGLYRLRKKYKTVTTFQKKRFDIDPQVNLFSVDTFLRSAGKEWNRRADVVLDQHSGTSLLAKHLRNIEDVGDLSEVTEGLSLLDQYPPQAEILASELLKRTFRNEFSHRARSNKPVRKKKDFWSKENIRFLQCVSRHTDILERIRTAPGLQHVTLGDITAYRTDQGLPPDPKHDRALLCKISSWTRSFVKKNQNKKK